MRRRVITKECQVGVPPHPWSDYLSFEDFDLHVLTAGAVIDRVIVVGLVDEEPLERSCLGVTDEEVVLVTVDTESKPVITIGLQ